MRRWFAAGSGVVLFAGTGEGVQGCLSILDAHPGRLKVYPTLSCERRLLAVHRTMFWGNLPLLSFSFCATEEDQLLKKMVQRLEEKERWLFGMERSTKSSLPPLPRMWGGLIWKSRTLKNVDQRLPREGGIAKIYGLIHPRERREGKKEGTFLLWNGTLLPKEGAFLPKQGWMLPGEGLFHTEEQSFPLANGTMLLKGGTVLCNMGTFLPGEGMVLSGWRINTDVPPCLPAPVIAVGFIRRRVVKRSRFLHRSNCSVSPPDPSETE